MDNVCGHRFLGWWMVVIPDGYADAKNYKYEDCYKSTCCNGQVDFAAFAVAAHWMLFAAAAADNTLPFKFLG